MTLNNKQSVLTASCQRVSGCSPAWLPEGVRARPRTRRNLTELQSKHCHFRLLSCWLGDAPHAELQKGRLGRSCISDFSAWTTGSSNFERLLLVEFSALSILGLFLCFSMSRPQFNIFLLANMRNAFQATHRLGCNYQVRFLFRQVLVSKQAKSVSLISADKDHCHESSPERGRTSLKFLSNQPEQL